MKLFNYHTIGSKLVLAFAGCSLLITIISAVALTTWNNLDNHVSTILDSSVPTLNTSYQLESHSAQLQALIAKIQASTNKAEHNKLKLLLDKELTKITKRVNHLRSNPDTSELNFGYAKLANDIDNLERQLLKRIDNQREIDSIKEKIHWIHQDIRDELLPLRQELQWQLTRVNLKHDPKGQRNNIADEFSTTQSLMDKESRVYEQIIELIATQHGSQIDNAFEVINYKLMDIHSLSESIFYHSSTIAYRQLLGELTKIMRPKEMLRQRLHNKLQLETKIDQANVSIQSQLAQQHKQIRNMVANAAQTLKIVKLNIKQTISYSNRLLIICFSISIGISLFLTLYFIRNRIINRLNQLSESLSDINEGKLDLDIKVSGTDEIGQIGELLRQFCLQMREMEKTNALNLINNTQASIITCDLFGKIESVNPSARQLFELPVSGELNMVWDCFSSPDIQELQSQFSEVGSLLDTGSGSVTLFIAADTSVLTPAYLKLDLHLFKQGHQQKVIITISDITEHIETKHILEMHVNEKTQSLTQANKELIAEVELHRRTEKNLRDTQTELIQAAKMAVVGQAMTCTAHELNQPLSAISTYLFSAQMALDKHEYDSLPNALKKIELLSIRMSKIVQNLRNFAKKNPADSPLIQIELHDIAEQARAIVITKAKRQQTKITNHLPIGIYTQADGIQLEQIIINLLVNSCDAVASSKIREIDIIYLGSNNESHTLAILDSGHGLEPEILTSLFTPFTTTKELGLGLGLSISQAIIERFHGAIIPASGLTGGAMLILELPQYDNK